MVDHSETGPFDDQTTFDHSKARHIQFSDPQCTLNDHPLCFLTAFCSEVTSQLLSRKGGGAPDLKNPDP